MVEIVFFGLSVVKVSVVCDGLFVVEYLFFIDVLLWDEFIFVFYELIVMLVNGECEMVCVGFW